MAFNRGNQAGSVQYEQNRTKNWSSRDTADEVDDGRARGPNSCRKNCIVLWLFITFQYCHRAECVAGTVRRLDQMTGFRLFISKQFKQSLQQNDSSSFIFCNYCLCVKTGYIFLLWPDMWNIEYYNICMYWATMSVGMVFVYFINKRQRESV